MFAPKPGEILIHPPFLKTADFFSGAEVNSQNQPASQPVGDQPEGMLIARAGWYPPSWKLPSFKTSLYSHGLDGGAR